MRVDTASVPTLCGAVTHIRALRATACPPTECPASPRRLSGRGRWTLDLEKLDSVPPLHSYVSSGLSVLIRKMCVTLKPGPQDWGSADVCR